MHGRTRCLVLVQFRCYRQDPSGGGRGELSDLLWQGQIPALCKESGHEKVGLLHRESLFNTLLKASLTLLQLCPSLEGIVSFMAVLSG